MLLVFLSAAVSCHFSVFRLGCKKSGVGSGGESH